MHLPPDPNLTRLPFDLYTRNLLIAEMLRRTGIDKPTILDVGGRNGRLEEFLGTPSRFWILDIRSDDLDQEGYVQGSIPYSPFKDESFDVVISSDCLEHIPQNSRKPAILEMLRTSRRYVILGAPFESPENLKAEERVNAYYRRLIGKPHLWLSEHRANGLPRAEDFEAVLRQANCSFTHIAHNNLSNWTAMQELIFTAAGHEVPLDLVEQVYDYYNDHFLNLGDLEPPCYRRIYLISKAGRLPDLSSLHLAGTKDSAVVAELHAQIAEVRKRIPAWRRALRYAGIRPQPVISALSTLAKANDVPRKTLTVFRLARHVSRPTRLRKMVQFLHFFGWRALIREIRKRLREMRRHNTIVVSTRVNAEQFPRMLPLEKELRGTFRAPVDSICAIQVFTVKQRSRSGGMALSLRDVKSNAVLREAVISGPQVKDGDYTTFRFPRVKESKGRTYEFSIDGLQRPQPLVWHVPDVASSEVTLECGGTIGFRVRSQSSVDPYVLWISKNEPQNKELRLQRAHRFALAPRISIITPTFNTPVRYLAELVASVLKQSYAHWELCIADGGSADPKLRTMLESLPARDGRIKVRFLPSNGGIVANTNAALETASGDAITFLDHDDLLPPFALYEMARALNDNPDADLIYGDEDKITADGRTRFEPHFKPAWSPDLLRSCNYITHALYIRRDLLRKIGPMREGFDGSQDYDLILRATEQAKKIVSIPKVLYHWRAHMASTAANLRAKTYAYEAARRAVADHLKRVGLEGTVESISDEGFYQVTLHVPRPPKVTIIIPNRDHPQDLEPCVLDLLHRCSYRNFEVAIVENGSTDPRIPGLYRRLTREGPVRILEWTKPFNYSSVNNLAVQQSDGELLLFLNNDTQVRNRDFIECMVEHAVRKEVGAVGAKLFYPDGTIQHAGVILGLGSMADHAYRDFPSTARGYCGRLQAVQNFSAVTAACMMVRRDVFQQVGGFDDAFVLAFGDIDLCLRIREKGYLIVWTPRAQMTHFESRTRGLDDTPSKLRRNVEETRLFVTRWGRLVARGDPYYSPNLTFERGDFSIRI